MSARLALTIIQAEHQALSVLLRALPQLLVEQRQQGCGLDFELLRSALFYLDEFPDRLHHAKESELLFPKLRARAPHLRGTLDRLDHEHLLGSRSVRDLEFALLGVEMLGETRRQPFEKALQRFVHGYMAHMKLEEAEILPAAIALLSDEDWNDLDEAFAANKDPLTGAEPSAIYQPLFERILDRLPPQPPRPRSSTD